MAAAVATVVLLLPILLVSALHEPDSTSLRLVILQLGGGLSAELGSSVSVGSASLITYRLPGLACARRRGGALRAVSLSLPFCGLDGSLSPAIGRLSALRELSLPGNLLSGEIPPEIAGCRRLQVLNLSRNALSGQVPPQISSLVRLRTLDISDNKISGSLEFLVGLPNLERLSLGGNLFTGRIPPVLSSIRRIRFLHLAGNPYLRGSFLKLPGVEEVSSSGELLPMHHIPAENSTHDYGRTAAAAPGPSASPSAKISRRQYVLDTFVWPLVMSIPMSIFSSVLQCLVDRWYGKRDDQEDPETELREEHSMQQEGRPAEEQKIAATNTEVWCVSVQIP